MNFPIRRVAVWLGLIIGFCYLGSINGSFHFDDSHSIESNIAVRSMANIPSFWTDSRTSSMIPENRVYRPLVYTFYSVCWALGGGQTWPFHLMKMGMHLLVCLALFLIWRRLWQLPGWFPGNGIELKFPLFSRKFQITPDSAAFLLAAVFAVHPAGSECVDYIAATTSLQCAMFYVWAYYAYLLFRDSKNPRHLAMGLVLYFLSVASKEEGITLPAMVFFSELFFASGVVSPAESSSAAWRKNISQALRGMLPFAVAGVLLAAWIFFMHPTEGNESRGWATPFSYFITQWRAYLWYMRIWFWPWDLNADNAVMVFSKSLSEPLVIQAAIGNGLLLLFGWLNRKRFPAMLFGLVWFYVTISPASSVVVLAEAINEHRMYLSYIGFVGGTFTVLLWAAQNLMSAETRERGLGFAFVAIFVGLIIGTQERNRVWFNEENLWLDTVEKNPTSGRALNNLALVYMARGENEKALKYLDDCERHWTTYAHCSLNKGIVYSSMNKFENAEKSFLRAYQLNPRNVHTNFNLGRFYLDTKKDGAKAVGYFRTAVEATGGRYPSGDIFLATALKTLNRTDEAKAALERALNVEPNNLSALFALAQLHYETAKLDDAAGTYRRLLGIHPNHAQSWYNLGVIRLARSDLRGAREAFEKTVAIDPKSEQGWYNLAHVGERSNDGVLAVNSLRKLVSLNSAKTEYQVRLGGLEKKFRMTRQ